MAVREEVDPRTPDPLPALLTIKQAARMLSLGRSTIYELIADGRLEVVHVGRSARIPADAIPQLVHQLRSGQAAT
jgi:excisionase family DNA binding protein